MKIPVKNVPKVNNSIRRYKNGQMTRKFNRFLESSSNQELTSTSPLLKRLYLANHCVRVSITAFLLSRLLAMIPTKKLIS